MNQGLQTYDYIVFVLYFILISSYGIWIYRKKKSGTTNTKDFFLAEGQLTWWAIGASLIASNISAEQFIGMSGNGFRLGLAISVYEWLAAVSVVAAAAVGAPRASASAMRPASGSLASAAGIAASSEP